MARPPDDPSDRTDALPPPEGTVDLRLASSPPADDTGAWQVAQLDAGATAQFASGSPVAPPAAEDTPEATGVWQPGQEAGGGTVDFVLGEEPVNAISGGPARPGGTTAGGLPRLGQAPGTQRRRRDATGGL